MVRFKYFGPPSVLELTKTPMPVLKGREVLIRIHAASINPVDNAVRAGKVAALLTVRPKVIRLTPGDDLAGVVEEVGTSTKV